eukprot:gene15902-biopygen5455
MHAQTAVACHAAAAAYRAADAASHAWAACCSGKGAASHAADAACHAEDAASHQMQQRATQRTQPATLRQWAATQRMRLATQQMERPGHAAQPTAARVCTASRACPGRFSMPRAAVHTCAAQRWWTGVPCGADSAPLTLWRLKLSVSPSPNGGALEWRRGHALPFARSPTPCLSLPLSFPIRRNVAGPPPAFGAISLARRGPHKKATPPADACLRGLMSRGLCQKSIGRRSAFYDNEGTPAASGSLRTTLCGAVAPARTASRTDPPNSAAMPPHGGLARAGKVKAQTPKPMGTSGPSEYRGPRTLVLRGGVG